MTTLIRSSLVLAALLAGAGFAAATPPSSASLPSGRYTFQHRFAEHPNLSSIQLLAKISGKHIVLVNRAPSAVFPKGVIAEGTLMWHAESSQWIIGNEPSDRFAKEVGGCSDGPEVVDLKRRIYWTC